MLYHHWPSESKPSRTVVLGSRGFIARRLIEQIRTDGISCRSIGAAEVDLTQPSAHEKLIQILQPDDCVIMCSAITPETGRDEDTCRKNIRMAENVCAALDRLPRAHVIYMSSDSVYDRSVELADEATRCASEDWYARSHIAREDLLRNACQRSGNSPLAILRPSAVYGAGDTHNSYGPNRFIRSAVHTGTIALFGDGEEIRDHIYIDDLVRLIKLAVLHRSEGVLNAVSGEARSFREVAEMVVNIIGRHVVLETKPRRVPIVHRRYRTAVLKKAFPEFQPTSLQNGLREMIGSFSFPGGNQDGTTSA